MCWALRVFYLVGWRTLTSRSTGATLRPSSEHVHRTCPWCIIPPEWLSRPRLALHKRVPHRSLWAHCNPLTLHPSASLWACRSCLLSRQRYRLSSWQHPRCHLCLCFFLLLLRHHDPCYRHHPPSRRHCRLYSKILRYHPPFRSPHCYPPSQPTVYHC